MRLRLDYSDHNERFAPLLPQYGIIERWVKSQDGSKWALFQLDHEIEYEGRTYSNLLLKSRWIGHEIGGKEQTAVFILLVGHGQDVTDEFNVKDFYHVAWGMIPPNRSGE